MDDLELDDNTERDELKSAIEICGINLETHEHDCVRDHLDLGCAYLLKGEYRKAIDDMTKTAEYINTVDVFYMSDRSRATVFVARGVAYYKIGEVDKAIADWKKAADGVRMVDEEGWSHGFYCSLSEAERAALKNLAQCAKQNNAEALELIRKVENMAIAMAHKAIGHACVNYIERISGFVPDSSREEFFKGDYAKAFEWWRKAADMGDEWAYFTLGLCYEKGEGVEQDFAKAEECFNKAVCAGIDYAKEALGNFQNHQGFAAYNKGNYTEAVEWFRKAADMGNNTAYSNLGECYRDGLGGLKQDFVTAEELFNKAIAAGYEGAKAELAKLKQTQKNGWGFNSPEKPHSTILPFKK